MCNFIVTTLNEVYHSVYNLIFILPHWSPAPVSPSLYRLKICEAKHGGYVMSKPLSQHTTSTLHALHGLGEYLCMPPCSAAGSLKVFFGTILV